MGSSIYSTTPAEQRRVEAEERRVTDFLDAVRSGELSQVKRIWKRNQRHFRNIYDRQRIEGLEGVPLTESYTASTVKYLLENNHPEIVDYLLNNYLFYNYTRNGHRYHQLVEYLDWLAVDEIDDQIFNKLCFKFFKRLDDEFDIDESYRRSVFSQTEPEIDQARSLMSRIFQLVQYKKHGVRFLEYFLSYNTEQPGADKVDLFHKRRFQRQKNGLYQSIIYGCFYSSHVEEVATREAIFRLLTSGTIAEYIKANPRILASNAYNCFINNTSSMPNSKHAKGIRALLKRAMAFFLCEEHDNPASARAFLTECRTEKIDGWFDENLLLRNFCREKQQGFPFFLVDSETLERELQSRYPGAVIPAPAARPPAPRVAPAVPVARPPAPRVAATVPAADPQQQPAIRFARAVREKYRSTMPLHNYAAPPSSPVPKDRLRAPSRAHGSSEKEAAEDIYASLRTENRRLLKKSALVEYLMREDFQLEEFKMLIATAGNDINQRHINGHTPLTYLLHLGRYFSDADVKLVKLILDSGANVNQLIAAYRNDFGSGNFTCPVELIIRNRRYELIPMLQEYGLALPQVPLTVFYGVLKSTLPRGIKLFESRINAIKILLEVGAELDYNFYLAMYLSRYSDDVKWRQLVGGCSLFAGTMFTTENFEPIVAKRQVLEFLEQAMQHYNKLHQAKDRFKARVERFRAAVLNLDFTLVKQIYGEHCDDEYQSENDILRNWQIIDSQEEQVFLMEHLLRNPDLGQQILDFLFEQGFILGEEYGHKGSFFHRKAWLTIPGLDQSLVLRFLDSECFIEYSSRSGLYDVYGCFCIFYSDQSDLLIHNLRQRLMVMPDITSKKIDESLIKMLIEAFGYNMLPHLEQHLSRYISARFVTDNKEFMLKQLSEQIRFYNGIISDSAIVTATARLEHFKLMRLFRLIANKFAIEDISKFMNTDHSGQYGVSLLQQSKVFVAPWLLYQDKFFRVLNSGNSWFVTAQKTCVEQLIPLAQKIFGVNASNKDPDVASKSCTQLPAIACGKADQLRQLILSLPNDLKLCVARYAKPDVVPSDIWRNRVLSYFPNGTKAESADPIAPAEGDVKHASESARLKAGK